MSPTSYRTAPPASQQPVKCSIPAQAGATRRPAPNPIAPQHVGLRHTRAIPVRLVPSLRSIDVPARHTCIRPAALRGRRARRSRRNAWEARDEPRMGQAAPSARPDLSQTVFDVELGYGLAPRLEVSVDVPVISRHIEAPDSPGAERAACRGSPTWPLRRNTGSRAARTRVHAFAASLMVELPTGSRARGLGSSLVDVGSRSAHNIV